MAANFCVFVMRIIASFSRYTVYLDFIKYLISNVLWLFLAPVSTTSKFSKYSCLGKGRYGRQQKSSLLFAGNKVMFLTFKPKLYKPCRKICIFPAKTHCIALIFNYYLPGSRLEQLALGTMLG